MEQPEAAQDPIISPLHAMQTPTIEVIFGLLEPCQIWFRINYCVHSIA